MKDVLEDSIGMRRPLSLLGGILTCGLTVAIAYNALWGQQAISTQLANSAFLRKKMASTHLEVNTNERKATTLILRYDPVIEEVQRNLTAVGDYKGVVDGVNGRQTRLAIVNYQKKAGLPASGDVNIELLDHMRFTRQINDASEYTGSVKPLGNEASEAEMRKLQTGLAELGYSPGEITGTMTLATQEAIMKFEKDYNMPETGLLTPQLLAELARITE